MTTYKIIHTTVKHFENIEVPFDFNENQVGDQIPFLGMSMSITQLGSSVVGLSNQSNIMILQEVPEVEETINIV